MKSEFELSVEISVRKWVEDNLSLVTPMYPVSIHLDHVYKGLKLNELVSNAVHAFAVLIEVLRELQVPAKPVLTIPLAEISREITGSVPRNLKGLEKQLHELTPPSLYLLDWGPVKFVALCEELSIPLPFKLLDNEFADDIYVYYREYRYGRGIKANWEFARSIYAEYYPDGVRVQ